MFVVVKSFPPENMHKLVVDLTDGTNGKFMDICLESGSCSSHLIKNGLNRMTD